MKKKVIALLLAVTMAFGLAACGSGDDSKDNSSQTTNDDANGSNDGDTKKDDAGTKTDNNTGEKILSVQIGPNPETIDPALNSAVDGGNMLLHNFECLLTVDKDGKMGDKQKRPYLDLPFKRWFKMVRRYRPDSQRFRIQLEESL